MKYVWRALCCAVWYRANSDYQSVTYNDDPHGVVLTFRLKP